MRPSILTGTIGSMLAALALAPAMATGAAPTASPANSAPTLDPDLPTIFIAGDSTAANGRPGAIGWGRYLGEFFDSSSVNVVNRARGGRSSRTFVTEGLWDALLADVKPGDFVLLQFGHNDGGPINGERIARGSLPGLGEETQEIENNLTHRHETVHTFGWYMRKMIADVRARQAQPILLSLTVRNIWKDGRVERGSGHYSAWTRELAESEKVPFVDLTNLAADRYEAMGEPVVKPLFPRDHTHTSEEGAELNARLIVSGLKRLRDNALLRHLSLAGREVKSAPPSAVWVPVRPPPRGAGRAEFLRWLNLPDVADPALPTVFLIGDSTVRNGRGDGYDGQWGWGDPFSEYFDPARVNVVNRAVGGTGARTFTTTGYWKEVLARLKPGDFVIMQFGHNDNGRRGALPGIGEETEEREGARGGPPETVHTFGWYLRRYIAETREHGATPIVCSLIPRNNWKDGRIVRARDSHADWARAVAAAEKAAFIDLHERIAVRYEALGREAVDKLFADGRVHTNWPGAELNAACVLEGLRALPGDPLAKFLRAPRPTDDGSS